METVPHLVATLKEAASAYYNGGVSKLDDDTYDELLAQLKSLDPSNPFLLQIGTPSSSQHHLPALMPSLDKIKPGESRLQRFLTSATSYVFSEKLDGLSALWVPSSKQLFLRGDGREGYSIPSSTVTHLKGLHPSQEGWIIRGELIMRRNPSLQNGRNIVNGLLHHKTPSANLLSEIEFIGYEVISPTGLTRSEQFVWLSQHNFKTPWWTIQTNPTEAICSSALLDRRKNSDYDTDGIVVGINQVPIHSSSSATGPVQNPKDCVAFKQVLSDQSATTTVKEVHWAPSAQGYLIPRIQFEPVLINGAKIEYCSGHNARTIVDKKVGPGAIVRIRRSGDVIPTLDAVLIPATASLPSIDWRWNGDETATHIVLVGSSEEQQVSQLYHFSKTIDIPGLGPSSCKALVEAGIKGPKALWETGEALLCSTLGPKTGKTLYTTLRTLPTNPTLTELTLMLASNTMPRGVGEAKLSALFKKSPDPRNWLSAALPPGWTQETFSSFLATFKSYELWRKEELYWIPYPIAFETSASPTPKEIICFTGFRDKEMEETLVKRGFKIGPMTAATTLLLIPDDGAETEKVKKARKTGVRVMTKSAFSMAYTV
jgi:NAD-dependent DNA ligase